MSAGSSSLDGQRKLFGLKARVAGTESFFPVKPRQQLEPTLWKLELSLGGQVGTRSV